jgi:16S rRNA (guanine527-N7)-methyltransferase
MRRPESERVLHEAAVTLGCPLIDRQLDQLQTYLELLKRWNRVYNLTALRDPQQMLVQHLLDSLSLVAPLRRQTRAAAFRWLDVGSGGGLPGVAVATALPSARVLCVEAVGKKAAFIRQAAMELGLVNLAVKHARVERLDEGPFDIVTSRAFASLDAFVSMTGSQLADGGVWVAMKGRLPSVEIEALDSRAAAVFHVEQLSVPGLVGERCLVWMRRPRIDLSPPTY